MLQYKVDFSVGNMRTQQIVSCNSHLEAEKLIRAQYPGQKITIWMTTRMN